MREQLKFCWKGKKAGGRWTGRKRRDQGISDLREAEKQIYSSMARTPCQKMVYL